MPIVVKFADGEKRKDISGELQQWDTGQVVEIHGIYEAVEIHWAQEGKSGTKTVIPTVKEGYIEAEIPDNLLTECRNLYAYIYLETAKAGETEYVIYFTVDPRGKPDDYLDPENKNIFAQIIEKLRTKADGLLQVNDTLQLLSGKTPIGNTVKLPQGGGEGENIEPITNQEIDNIMKGE